MKLMFASDIHGSLHHAKAVCDIFKKEGAEKLVLLGDILYHGPRNDLPKEYNPKGVIELMNQMREKILCVRGNCDTEVDQMVLNFPILADYALLYDGKTTMYLSHGHIYNPDNLLAGAENCVLVNGHTHIYALEKREWGIYANPGSVSIPKNSNPPTYMIYENGRFEIKDLDGVVLKVLDV